MKKILMFAMFVGFVFAVNAQTKSDGCCTSNTKEMKVTKTIDGNTTTVVTTSEITSGGDAAALPESENGKKVVKKEIVKVEKKEACEPEGSSKAECCSADKKSDKEKK